MTNEELEFCIRNLLSATEDLCSAVENNTAALNVAWERIKDLERQVDTLSACNAPIA